MEKITRKYSEPGHIRQPFLARIALKLLVNHKHPETVLADYEEHYTALRKEKGKLRANVFYWIQIFKSIPPFVKNSMYWSTIMFKSYLKVAMRNMYRHKSYSFINTFGLSLAVACCLVIFLFIKSELTFDSFHENSDRIYRLLRVDKNQDGSVRRLRGGLSMPVGPAIVGEIANVEESVRFLHISFWTKVGDKEATEVGTFADPSLFRIFTFPMKYGNNENPLPDKNSVVISQNIARKYYGDENPIGRLLSVKVNDAYDDFTVTGVAEDIPENSSIKFDVLLHFRVAEESDNYRVSAKQWRSFSTATFVMLREGSNAQSLDGSVEEFTKTHWNNSPGLRLQRLEDIHLDTSVGANILAQTVSNPMNSYILGGIAAFILGIACINFMNLTIGQSSTRLREVGMRKVLGAQRKQLIKQFWGEALFLSFISMFLGLILANFFLPTFNTLANKNLSLNLVNDFSAIGAALGLMFIIGLISGSYPSLVVAGFNTVEVLKGKLRVTGTSYFGKFLLVVQFSLSILLMVSTMLMSDQLHFLKNKDLGYSGEQVIEIPIYETDNREQVVQVFKNTLSGHSNFVQASSSSGTFTRFRSATYIEAAGKGLRVYYYKVDHDYFDTLKMEVVEGRGFSKELTTDNRTSIVVNEKLRDELLDSDLGWDSVLQKNLPGQEQLTIIGVVKNYHNLSLHTDIPPVFLHMNDSAGNTNFIYAKIAERRISESIEILQDTWSKIVSNIPFTYTFLDETVEAQYRADERWGSIVQYASVIAIAIACLGLFGLTSLTVSKRVKEIGIRKVMGSSVGNLVRMINAEFMLLVLLANVVAWPSAYYVLKKWLQTFAYHTTLDLTTFVAAGLIVMFISILTVSFLAIRAALTNPVKSLRQE